MAQLERHGSILVVTGSDLYPVDSNDPREGLRAFLYQQTAQQSPVRRGTHDFWCVFGLPTSIGGEGGERWEDASLTPRPLRGIASIGTPPDAVRQGQPPTANDTARLASLADGLHTALQEVAHHWLVYPDRLSFTVGGQPQQMDVDDFIHISLDQPFTGPLLAGRSALHWSTYMQADGSPMDGQKWHDLGTDAGLDHWQWSDPPALGVLLPTTDPPPPLPRPGQPQPAPRPGQPPGRPVRPAPHLPEVVITQSYNDLDLLAMGAITAAEAYRSTGGRFAWMEPWYAAPLPSYLAGVFVAFSATDFLYFGFDSDHRQLSVSRTDGTRYGGAGLGSGYHPWPGRTNTGVALRVVRRGDELVCQARFDDSALQPTVSPVDFDVSVGPLPPAVPGLFDGLSRAGRLAAPPSGPDFGGFRTVASVRESRAPMAVGLIAKTSTACWVDAVYSHLETLVPAARLQPHTVYPLTAVPPLLAPKQPFRALPPGIHLHKPVDPPAPLVIPWHGRLRLRPPAYAEVTQDGLDANDPRHPPYDHTATTDKAPKVVLAAPPGDFAFGTSVAIRRTAFRRSAGGAVGRDPATNRPATELWGHARTLPVTDARVVTGFEQHPPPDDTYRFAFILCAPQRSDITNDHLASLDLLRRYWDVAFRLCTRGRRRSNSTLS